MDQITIELITAEAMIELLTMKGIFYRKQFVKITDLGDQYLSVSDLKFRFFEKRDAEVIHFRKKCKSINPSVIIFLHHIRIKANGNNRCPHSYRISNHCQSDIHPGKLLGINNKIKTIKRKTCDYDPLRYWLIKS